MSLPVLTSRVGNTPLRRIEKLATAFPGVEVHAKLEFFNPGGSVKDRAALQMVKAGLASGALKPGTNTLIDSTSGNTGVAYAWLGAALGFKVALVMPANVSIARKQISLAYGAELLFSDPMEGSDGAIRHVRKLVEGSPQKYFYPDQYSNEGNPQAHYEGTGPEIYAQTGGRVTHFICGMGTTGTVMGAGRRLKEYRSDIQIIGVEPLEPMHGLEGLKHMDTSLKPGIYEPAALDEKLSVSTDEGWDMAERLAREEGLLVGYSGGAALAGTLKVAERLHAEGRPGVLVTLFPDRADRYFEPRPWARSYAW